MINYNLLLKAICWRFIAASITVALIFIVSGSLVMGFTVGIADTVIKILAYYGFDIFWLKLKHKFKKPPQVLWLTGLSGAGKTTIAKALQDKLTKLGYTSALLDGDEIRAILPSGFDKESRMAHVRRVGEMARVMEDQGIIPIVSLISPYKKSRDDARKLAKRFMEIYVATDIEVCRKRDPKGLYAKADAGEIKEFTGVDAPYEIPENPELVIDTSKVEVMQSVKLILKSLD